VVRSINFLAGIIKHGCPTPPHLTGMGQKTAIIDIRVEPQLVERIDAWRARQRMPPSRAAAIVYMLDQFLEHDPPELNAAWKRLLSKAYTPAPRGSNTKPSMKTTLKTLTAAAALILAAGAAQADDCHGDPTGGNCPPSPPGITHTPETNTPSWAKPATPSAAQAHYVVDPATQFLIDMHRNNPQFYGNVIDSRYNSYRVNLNISNCSVTNGAYEGLAVSRTRSALTTP
jgi:hypothetical protein